MKKIILLILVLLFSANICFAADFGGIYTGISNAGKAAALLAIIWGGIRYILSIGDPGLAAEAKTWVIAGFAGLALILCADTIIPLITGKEISWQIQGEPEIASVPELPESPGIHFYSLPNCSTEVGAGGVRIQSIKIVNGGDKEFAVAIQSIDNDCAVYSGSGCYNLTITPAFSYPYELNPEAEGEIKLCRRPYYGEKCYSLEGGTEIRSWGLSAFVINDGECGSLWMPDAYCLGSIEFPGSYTILLYNQEGKCEVYEPQLVEEEWGGAERNIKIRGLFSQNKAFQITVIPIKR